jgi:drug/metabolite transporter (DMT)-like permease
MTWQLLLTIYLILGTASYLIRRRLATTLEKHNKIINAFFYVAVLYPIGLAVAFFTNPDLDIGWQNFLIILFASAVFPVISILGFRASKDVDAGLFTILHNLTPIITVITASVLLNETLNGQQQLGAVLVLSSALLASASRYKNRKQSSVYGLVLVGVCIALAGVAIVFERWMLGRIDFGAYLVFGWGSQALWMAIVAWPERNDLAIFRKNSNLKLILGYALTNALKGLCFVGALKIGNNASVIGVYASFMSVLVVISAYFILKEKEHLWAKISAATIGAIGLAILSVS